MNKLWLIIQREYLTRVRKKSFILTTILLPLGIGLFMVFVAFLMTYQDGEANKIVIIDESNVMKKAIKDERDLYFSFSNEKLADLKQAVEEEKYNGVLVIPNLKNINTQDFTVNYYSEDQLGLATKIKLEQKIGRKIRDYKVDALGFDKEQLESLKSNVTIDPEPIKAGGQDRSSITSMVLAGIGYMLGFIMYFIIIINGMMVMTGVMEEKTNRIVEVMVSSVKPFQLMLGKILGIGAVTLTQVGIWAILFPLIFIVTQFFFGIDTSEAQMEMAAANSGMDEEEAQHMIMQVANELGNINWWLIIPAFIVYLLMGFFMYSAMFAAVGSAIGDDLGESQKLTFPISIPAIISVYLLFPVVASPNGSLATWASIIPISSPFIMPARLAFDPPLWEVALSLIILIATTIFFVWLSAKIYRVGIFLYGKRVTFKEMGKWLFYKG